MSQFHLVELRRSIEYMSSALSLMSGGDCFAIKNGIPAVLSLTCMFPGCKSFSCCKKDDEHAIPVLGTMGASKE
jgi:hypothetical protein